MGNDSDPFARGFLNTLGSLFGTVVGRVFALAVVAIGGTAMGTKIGAPDRFTGTQGMEHHRRIQAVEQYVRDHEVEADRYKHIITTLQVQVGQCQSNLLKVERRLEHLEHPNAFGFTFEDKQ